MRTRRPKFSTINIYYNVIYESDSEGGFVAFVPALPGCHSQGETLEQTKKNIREAIEVYLLSLKNNKESIPVEDKSLLGIVDVQLKYGL